MPPKIFLLLTSDNLQHAEPYCYTHAQKYTKKAQRNKDVVKIVPGIIGMHLPKHF